ncbi:MAG: Uma2 family endonuclease [Pleurocapsa sp. CRU_1_2]|nr:Uma2 family endonuclease [Pleurocapsa sp. CRU_1_2]
MIETINIKALANSITDEQFEQLCAQNRDTKFELTSQGELIVMSPTGSESGRQNGDLFGQIWYWNRQTKLGIVFDSSTGFTLPNDAKRSPDVSWIKKSRWDELTTKQKRKFAPLAPDFVIELLSPNDRLSDVQSKMTEYQACGVKLGWLIDPDEKRVEIYRVGKQTEVLLEPKNLSGEDLMPNLTVDLLEIF